MKWNIVYECDNDNGEHTEWYCKLGEHSFVWIDKIGTNAYGITNKSDGNNYIHISKSLQAAKRWVNNNIIKIL